MGLQEAAQRHGLLPNWGWLLLTAWHQGYKESLALQTMLWNIHSMVKLFEKAFKQSLFLDFSVEICSLSSASHFHRYENKNPKLITSSCIVFIFIWWKTKKAGQKHESHVQALVMIYPAIWLPKWKPTAHDEQFINHLTYLASKWRTDSRGKN